MAGRDVYASSEPSRYWRGINGRSGTVPRDRPGHIQIVPGVLFAEYISTVMATYNDRLSTRAAAEEKEESDYGDAGGDDEAGGEGGGVHHTDENADKEERDRASKENPALSFSR
jgi:hypothetical protein